MKQQINIIASVVAIMVTACFSGCRTTLKPTITPGNLTLTEEPSTPKMRFKALNDSTPEYECVSVPVKLQISTPARISFSGKAYIVRDESIFLSLRKFGMEVAQLYVTSDSILAVDKFNKKVVSESLSQFIEQCPVNIHDIQNLLFGQPFLPGEKPDADKFIFEEQTETAQWLAIPSKQYNNLELGFAFSLDDNSLKSLAVKGGSTTFTSRYSYFYPTPGGAVASKCDIDIKNPKMPVEISLMWDWGSASWNNPSDMKKQIPSIAGYKKIPVQTLLKALK